MTTIKFRRDTSANWTSVNPIPAQGEPCYETNTGKLKIGNGSDNYVALPYVSDGGGSAPTNMVTTDTTQTISGDKTFTGGITTAHIYPTGEITFNSASQSRYINNIDSINGGYHYQNGYLTFKGDTTLVGDNKLVLDGRAGGLKLTAASSANITCENTLIAPNIKTTTNKKYLTEEDVDNQTIQIVEGKLHANLDELGNEVNSLSSKVTTLESQVGDVSAVLDNINGEVI